MSEGTFKSTNTTNQYDLIIPDFASENVGDVYYSGDIIYNDGREAKQIPRTKAPSHRIQVYHGSPKIALEIDTYLVERIEFCVPSIVIWEKYTSIVIETYWEEKSQPEKSFNLSKDASSCSWEALRMISDSK